MKSSTFRTVLGVTALAVAVVGTTTATADFVPADYQNGGFEDPVIAGDTTGPGYKTFSQGQTVGTNGWLVESGEVDVVDSTYAVFSGAQALDLNGCQAGSISQTFATVPGKSYSVLYWVNDNGGDDWNIAIDIAGAGPNGNGHYTGSAKQGTSGLQFGIDEADGLWERWGPSGMVATDNEMKVTFTSLETGCGGVVLDDIRVIATNATPTAANQSVSTAEDTPKEITLGPSNDADGDVITYAVTDGPDNGTLGTVTGNTVTYTPNANYNNTAATPDTFAFTAKDAYEPAGTPGTVGVEVTPVVDESTLTQTSSSNGIYTNKKVSVNLHTLLGSTDPACLAGRTVTYTLDNGAGTATGTTDATGKSAGKFSGLVPGTVYQGTASTPATSACGAASTPITYTYTQPKK